MCTDIVPGGGHILACEHFCIILKLSVVAACGLLVKHQPPQALQIAAPALGKQPEDGDTCAGSNLFGCFFYFKSSKFSQITLRQLPRAHRRTGTRLDGVDAAADHLSHAIALEPRFWPALVEKARLWASVGDWEQVSKSKP